MANCADASVALLPLKKLHTPYISISNTVPKKIKASSVEFKTKIKGGALSINICGCYKVQIYVYYWIWIIPLSIINIWLLYKWYISDGNALLETGFIAVGTVFLAALVRDKIFMHIIYHLIQKSICCTQYVRYHISRIVDCIGGLHSSSGIMSLIWNTVYARDMFVTQNYEFNIISCTATALPICLFIVCLSALPFIRYYHHNAFEVIHRYLNWLCLIILTVHVILVHYDEWTELYATNKLELMYHCVFNTASIFVMCLLILTVYPWIIIHKINGRDIEIIPSKSGESIAFIVPISCPMGTVCKLSMNWIEFHVLGIAPLVLSDNNGKHKSLILIKSLGDWSKSINTKSLKSLKSKHFWIHRIKAPNFSQGLFNWNKVFALATGIGIAPLLPYIIHPKYYNVQISLLWIARDHELNYPKFIIDILKPLKNVILYDTTKEERPNLPLLTMQKVHEFGAEAVFVISNPKIAYKIANYVNKKGVPVYASNWDV